MIPRLRLPCVISSVTQAPRAARRAADTKQESRTLYAPGEVLVLLTPIDDLEAGLYVVHALVDGWAVLRSIVDQEETETLWVTERETTLPGRALDLFMPVGINLRAPA